MGVLDDAIREHLELKRQHGASADEVTKQEQEALGALQGQPVASEPAAGAPPATEPAIPAPPVKAEPPEAPPAPDEPAAVADGPETVVEPATSEPEPWLDPEPDAAPPATEPSGDTPPRGFEEVPDVPAPVREAPLPDEGSGEEDVLEETPEFLQETPEHDRLWFEQKPPRDFDFDN
jgi:hypothetical protein